MAKEIKAYQVGDRIFWHSHEGIKGNGNGYVVDAWLNDKNQYYITAKNNRECVCLTQKDIDDLNQ